MRHLLISLAVRNSIRLGTAGRGWAWRGLAGQGKARFFMMTIEFWMEGVTPILLHRATEEALSGETRSNTVQEREDPRTIAGKAVYRLEGMNQLAFPGSAFARMVREAGGAHKAKGSRKSLKYLVPAAVLILDDLCPFFLRDRKTLVVDFEVDSRPVTIPATKGRVMRHRARLNEWALRASLRLNETLMSEAIVRQLLIEGGEQIGLGDFRPEKGGPFGTSTLVQWNVMSEPKIMTDAQKRNGEARTL